MLKKAPAPSICQTAQKKNCVRFNLHASQSAATLRSVSGALVDSEQLNAGVGVDASVRGSSDHLRILRVSCNCEVRVIDTLPASIVDPLPAAAQRSGLVYVCRVVFNGFCKR